MIWGENLFFLETPIYVLPGTWKCPLFLGRKNHLPKEGPNSKQNRGQLGSRCIYVAVQPIEISIHKSMPIGGPKIFGSWWINNLFMNLHGLHCDSQCFGRAQYMKCWWFRNPKMVV